MEKKVCKNCGFEGELVKHRRLCKPCVLEEKKIYRKEYYINNKAHETETNKEYNKAHKEEILKKKKEYRENHKEYNRNYNKNYRKNRKLTDPAFKLRHNISNQIGKALKRSGGSKNGNSCLNFLPGYNLKQLEKHLEDQFATWMTWQNHGILKNWDDNDPTTWTWQLDHKIPQSDLPFENMEEENFKICWGLDNLRPLSAKQNNSDGSNRTRHKKKDK